MTATASTKNVPSDRLNAHRWAVLSYLAERPVLVFNAETIHRRLDPGLKAGIRDVRAALSFLVKFGFAHLHPHGAADYYQVTVAGSRTHLNPHHLWPGKAK